ncbi:hypothetical protein, partial [Burkholderia pseudomallei]|uniref:hypothetical protein n=1 Tax=Burkholderia pseudomallei TaxID=28450 RepID=UPI0009784C68
MRRRAFEPALHRIGASQRARLVVPDVVRRALGSRPRVPRDDVSAVGARIAPPPDPRGGRRRRR